MRRGSGLNGAKNNPLAQQFIFIHGMGMNENDRTHKLEELPAVDQNNTRILIDCECAIYNEQTAILKMLVD